ncbi:MAG: hypothetical protein IMZ43_12425 [Thermoplasmata archaeon]|nr:hypothetical protein [Thermoplasmata archaeon]
MTGFELATLLIAIWGAGLSTLLGLNELLAYRRQAVVKLKAGMIYQGGDVSWTVHTIQISFFNKGKRPITITSYGLELPNNQHMPVFHIVLGREITLPRSFSDGEGCEFIGDRERITRSIRDEGLTGNIKIRGYVQDISGKIHFSRKMKISI